MRGITCTESQGRSFHGIVLSICLSCRQRTDDDGNLSLHHNYYLDKRLQSKIEDTLNKLLHRE